MARCEPLTTGRQSRPDPEASRRPNEIPSDLLEAPVSGDEGRALEEAQLAQALLRRHEGTFDLEALEEAKHRAEEAVALSPPGGTSTAQIKLLLSRADLEYFRAFGDPTNLDRAVALARDVLDSTSRESGPVYEWALQTLADVMKLRYSMTLDPAAQDEAIAALRLLEASRRERGGHTE